MHSCIQTSSIQIDSKCMQSFTAQSWTPQCHQDISEKCSRLRIYLQIFMVTIKQIPIDTSLTASTNVISMQYPNTILNTKMTLPQLAGPIDVVSPEHSSGDRSHEFQIASSKNASIEFILQSRICTPHQCRTRTLYHFSSFIQICTKPEAFLAHQPKIPDISTPPFEGSFVHPWRRSNGYPYRAKTVSTPYQHP